MNKELNLSFLMAYDTLKKEIERIEESLEEIYSKMTDYIEDTKEIDLKDFYNLTSLLQQVAERIERDADELDGKAIVRENELKKITIK